MVHFLLLATVVVTTSLARPVSAAPLSLPAAVDLAVQRSETARSARAGVTSAAEAARAAAQLPDPMLRVSMENLPVTGPDRFSTTREPMTMKRFGISQEWLSGEKRDARRAAAEAAVGKESVQERIAAADARLQTALAYIDAFYVGETLQLTTMMEHHAHEQLETARARVASASGSSEEVLRLGAARGMAEDESAELRQQQSAARVALQRWIGTRADELVEPGGFPVPSEDAYVAADPLVASLQREIEVARTAATATSSNRHPNWTWEVAYEQRSGYSDMVSFGVTIPLPVAPASRQDRETASKLALVEKAEAELTEAIRAAQGEYLALVSDLQRLRELIERATERLKVVVPLTLAVIFVLLYLLFRSFADAALVMAAASFALVGGLWLVWALGHSISVASAVGFIALAGIAAEFGVVMLVYLKSALARRLAAGEPANDETLLAAIREGAVLRVRPRR